MCTLWGATNTLVNGEFPNHIGGGVDATLVFQLRNDPFVLAVPIMGAPTPGADWEAAAAQARLLTATQAYDSIYESESRFASDYGNRLMQLSIATAGLLIDSRDEIIAAMEGIYTNSLDGGTPHEHAAQVAPEPPPTPRPKSKTPANRKTDTRRTGRRPGP